MNRTKKRILAVMCLVAAILLLRFIWIHIPSEATAIFYIQETDEIIEETLSYEETVIVKRILFGKIQWPEGLYGYPACGFGEIFSITIDGKCYMPAWDSCGMVAVMEMVSGDEVWTYVNISQSEKEILNEIISSRGAR